MEIAEQEHLSNPPNPQGEKIKPDNAVISHNILQTNSETENMEVHKHAHHVTHKKKWGEYLLEFLMLFLAVFLGFVAENIREHQVEKEKESQFIKSLTIDLADDIKGLDAMITFERAAISKLDTMMYLLNEPVLAKKNGDQLYYVARVGARAYPFVNNGRTFDQLKNSGSFRLIRNGDASNKIMDYYNQFFSVRLLEDNYNHEFDNFKHVAAKIFDFSILRRQENDRSEIVRSNDNPSLLTYNSDMLKEVGFHTLQMNGSRRSKEGMLESLRKSAIELKAYLEKEYHLAGK